MVRRRQPLLTGSKSKNLKAVTSANTKTCKLCNIQVSSQRYEMHLQKEHHIERPFQCQECPKDFKKNEQLKLHMLGIHLDDKKFKCTKCSKKYITNALLQRHIKISHARKAFTCKECNKSYSHEYKLKEHLKLSGAHAVNGSKFKCNECDKEYLVKKSLIKHLLTVHFNQEPDTVECNYCDKTLNKGSYGKHVKAVHSKMKPYKCDICLKQFSYSNYLKQHRALVHITKQEYGCSKCSKVFKTEKLLKQHFTHIHAPKAYECTQCCKTFGSFNILQKHFKTTLSHQAAPNGTLNLFQCSICSKRFHLESNLKSHMKIHEEPSYQCDYCLRKFTHKWSMKQHLKLQHKCFICGEVFPKVNAMQVHMKLKHSDDKEFKCEVCLKQFFFKKNLKDHLMFHIYPKKYRKQKE